MPVYEGRWDCSQCNTVGIPGGMLNCPTCGDSRNPLLDPSESPYLPTNASIVTDEEDLQLAESGPTWNCGTCGQANRGTDRTCRSCDEPRGANDDEAAIYTYVSGVDAEGVALSDPSQLDDDRVNAVLQGADPLQELEDGPVVMPSRTLHADALHPQDTKSDGKLYASSGRLPRMQISGRLKMSIAVLLGLVFLVMGSRLVYTNFIQTKNVDLTVRSLSWERQVEVESFKTLTKQDWSVPSDGRVVSSSREVRSYNRVIDHYDTKIRQVPERKQTGSHPEQYVCGSKTVNKGNGYYETQSTYCTRPVPDYTTVYHPEPHQVPVYRNDPIYDTKYTYQVDRWITDHFERASGRSNPQWPEPKISNTKQRVGDERRQTYDVVLVDPKGRDFERQLDEAAWSRIREGMTLHGEQTRSGSVKKVEWP